MNAATSDTPRLRVAAYCHIAADGEEREAFLETQREYYAEQIAGNPSWIMAGIFTDIGDSRSPRPQFQKMLRKCRQRCMINASDKPLRPEVTESQEIEDGASTAAFVRQSAEGAEADQQEQDTSTQFGILQIQ